MVSICHATSDSPYITGWEVFIVAASHVSITQSWRNILLTLTNHKKQWMSPRTSTN
jgi:hypothetical protein